MCGPLRADSWSIRRPFGINVWSIWRRSGVDVKSMCGRSGGDLGSLQDKLTEQSEIRGQLEFNFDECEAVPLDEVEPAAEIVKRFCTGAASLGSISDEARSGPLEATSFLLLARSSKRGATKYRSTFSLERRSRSCLVGSVCIAKRLSDAARHRMLVPERRRQTGFAIDTFEGVPGAFRELPGAYKRIPRLPEFQGRSKGVPGLPKTCLQHTKTFQGLAMASRAFQVPLRSRLPKTSQDLPRCPMSPTGPNETFEGLTSFRKAFSKGSPGLPMAFRTIDWRDAAYRGTVRGRLWSESDPTMQRLGRGDRLPTGRWRDDPLTHVCDAHTERLRTWQEIAQDKAHWHALEHNFLYTYTRRQDCEKPSRGRLVLAHECSCNLCSASLCTVISMHRSRRFHLSLIAHAHLHTWLPPRAGQTTKTIADSFPAPASARPPRGVNGRPRRCGDVPAFPSTQRFIRRIGISCIPSLEDIVDSNAAERSSQDRVSGGCL